MNMLKLSDNIALQRRKKGITQEELASFIGVTKASVSKWENGQSMPDIMILPELASYFDISVDELLGYEPYLSEAQILKLHEDIKKSFAKKTYEAALEECHVLVKKYYSCYPFLFTVCCIYLNHYNLAGSKEAERALLSELVDIAGHILKNCRNIHVCNDTIAIKAMADLLLGNADSVVESLREKVEDTFVYASNELTLIKAYQMLGDMDMANQTAQFGIYTDIMSLVTTSIIYIELNISDKAVCYETIDRVRKIIKAYNLNSLHPNIIAQFHIQAAIAQCFNNDHEAAIASLGEYVNDIEKLMVVDEMTLHGDEYFSMFNNWAEYFKKNINPPRNARLVWESIVQIFDLPVFEPLRDDIKFKNLKKKLEGGQNYGRN